MLVRKTAYTLMALGLVGGWISLEAQGPVQGTTSDKDIVAEVNGKPITRQQLADELIARRGRSQLEALVNRTLIEQTCKSKGIVVSDREVQEELISEMKASASANLADFEKSMLRPRKTSLFEYREDVIRPRIMIEKLAVSQLAVTEEDLKREFACKYGVQAEIRMIQFKDPRIAKKTWTEINNNPEMFIRYARIQENGDLAAVAGLMNPFGRHTTHDVIENCAFTLKDGEISEVLGTPERGFAIIMKVRELPARTNVTFEQKVEELRQSALEKKRRTEVPKIVEELKKMGSTQIKVYLGNENDTKRLIEQYEKPATGSGQK